MNKLLVIVLFISTLVLAQSNSQLIDIGEGGVSWVSKNGQYVCGSNWPNPPFIWSETTGRIQIGNVEGESFSVSNNGIVVGRFRDSSLIVGGEPVLCAGYWVNNQWNVFEGMTGVPPLDAQSYTHVYGINSEGTKAVGMVWHPNWRVEACYWSIPDTGIGLLGQTGNFNSRANVISDDESIIAGWDGIQNGPDRRAFYWDYAPHFMGGFDPTYLVGECRGMNSDGSVIVGGSVWPFIWTQSTGMQHIVADSSLYFNGEAIGISDNGIIVGYVRFSIQNYQAFIKKPGWNDIILMEDYILDSLGITGYQGWYFPFGQGISADGNRIGLTAYPPGSGLAHALILTIDSTVPVELTSFTASIFEKSVLLNWSTATETNNSGFEVQRKSDLEDWKVIGFVSGSGTTTETRNYSYSDELFSEGSYSYRLKQIDHSGSYEYSDEIKVEISFPNEFELTQNYPNPFNPSTVIEFSLPENVGNVQLSIYNTLGEKVAELVNTNLTAGHYKYQWNAQNAATGIYTYELRTDRFVTVKKMLLLK
jgi:hypothetical protein